MLALVAMVAMEVMLVLAGAALDAITVLCV